MSIAFVEPHPTLPPRNKPVPPAATETSPGQGGPGARPAVHDEGATQAVIDQAQRQLRAGRVDEALGALQQLARLKPDNAAVCAQLGLALRQVGRLDDAVHELDEATRLAPGDAGYHHQLGLTCRMLRRFDLARRAFERAIEIDPEHAGALIGLGLLHDRHFDEPALAAPLYLRGAALLPAEAAMIHQWLNGVMRRCARAAPRTGDKPDVPRR